MRVSWWVCALALLVMISTGHPATAASGRTFQQTIPFGGIFYGCGTYAVAVTGELRILEHIDLDERTGGMKMHITITARGSGTSIPAPGTTEIAAYTLLGTDHITMHLGPLPATTNVLADVHLIGQGSAPDSTFYIRVHITVNANGIPTASYERADCRGQAA